MTTYTGRRRFGSPADTRDILRDVHRVHTARPVPVVQRRYRVAINGYFTPTSHSGDTIYSKEFDRKELAEAENLLEYYINQGYDAWLEQAEYVWREVESD